MSYGADDIDDDPEDKDEDVEEDDNLGVKPLEPSNHSTVRR